MNIIEIKNLTKVYRMGDTEVSALKGVSLSIEKGEFVAITGFSGSGKSTLMHLMGCLDIATQGEYMLDDVNVGNATRDDLAKIRNRKIGFVFQKFHLLPDLTAQDNVALPRLYAGIAEAQARKEAAELLKLVNLADRMHHFPHQLSGGQQQRVAIARSLINKPAIILADEPTGNLDVATGDAILEIFTQLNTQQGVTIILVTHEPSIAAKANRIIELKDGNVISDKRST